MDNGSVHLEIQNEARAAAARAGVIVGAEVTILNSDGEPDQHYLNEARNDPWVVSSIQDPTLMHSVSAVVRNSSNSVHGLSLHHLRAANTVGADA